MKKFLMLITMLIISGNILADSFSVSDLTVKKGETANLVINYQFDVAGLYAGYQFELKLPAGVETIRDDSGSSEFVSGNCHDATYIISNSYDAASGAVIFVAFSLQAKALTGTSGVLLTIPVKIDNSILPGSVLYGSIENIQLSKSDGNTTTFLEDSDFTVTIDGGVATAIGEARHGNGDIGGDAPVFNLAGQRLAAPRKGINLVNGKKIVIK